MNPSNFTINSSVQIVKQLQILFPSLPTSQINNSNSFSLLLEGVVKNIPIPHSTELMYTIKSMKEAVDGQQLRIQKGMIEIQNQLMDLPTKPILNKYTSISTDDYNKPQILDEVCNDISEVWDWDIKQDLIKNISQNRCYFDFTD